VPPSRIPQLAPRNISKKRDEEEGQVEDAKIDAVVKQTPPVKIKQPPRVAS